MNDIARYNFRETEAKWQRIWAQSGAFKAAEDSKKPHYYVLEMFPYPSGNIHLGHVRNYTLGDVIAARAAAQGFNDAAIRWDGMRSASRLRMPPSNAAPTRKDWTLANIAIMREQLKGCGLSYDWEREFATCLPDYYTYEQGFFLKFLEKGLAYRKESEVNWDPVDNTVLANEQVIEGRGWRSGALVERKKLSQWFLKISSFADELLEGLKSLDQWPEKVRIAWRRNAGSGEILSGATLFPWK